MSLTTAEFDYIRSLVHRASAIVLNDDKTYLAESRLQSVMRQEGFNSFTDLIAKLRSEPHNGLHQKVVEAMTTHETFFFRDEQPFEALRGAILPEVIKANQMMRCLQIWSAASSTGQEAYSIAMTVREHFPELADWHVHVLATDLATDVLAKARIGRYSQAEISRGLPTRMLVKYFEKKGVDWEIKAALRAMVEFMPLNLIDAWPVLPHMDIIFLRNVLIYFDVETKKQILARIRQVLRPGGFLFLGGAETTFNIDEHFERLDLDRSNCYRLRKR